MEVISAIGIEVNPGSIPLVIDGGFVFSENSALPVPPPFEGVQIRADPARSVSAFGPGRYPRQAPP